MFAKQMQSVGGKSAGRNICKYTGYPTVDLNGASPYGFMVAQGTTANGFRESSQTAFLDRLTTDPNGQNLHLLLNATVTKVVFESGKAVGVLVQFSNETTIRIDAEKEVILAAGAINTPKILILSGVGPSAKLDEVSLKMKRKKSFLV